MKPIKVVGIIPARYGSTRFPGKPLATILGKSMIQRTYESASLSQSLDAVYVATDDERIYEHVKSFNGHVIMTSPDCMTGSDRLTEAIQKEPALQNAEIIINIQGDEPCIEATVIDQVAQLLMNDEHAPMSTAIMKIQSKDEAMNPSIVKCVADSQGNALYFSRSLIPGGKDLTYNPLVNYFRHLGIYGYRREFLLKYGQLAPTPLQIAEDLEQLKVLENGYKIKTAVVDSHNLSVDHPEDIKKVELFLCKQNTYS